MKSIPEWTQHFQIPPEIISSWEVSNAGKSSLTFWCLEKGAIEGHTYLDWARDHFQLSSVGTEFFQAAPDFEFWQQISAVANWSEELVPLAQWDGVVYIGCVEPPTDIQWSFPVCYVLAHAFDLKQHWQALQRSQTMVPENSFPAEPVMATAPEATPEPVASGSEFDIIETTNEETTDPVQAAENWEAKLNDWAKNKNDGADAVVNEPIEEVSPESMPAEDTLTAAPVVPPAPVVAAAPVVPPAPVVTPAPVVAATPVVTPAPAPVSATPAAPASAQAATTFDQPEGLKISVPTASSAKPMDPMEALRKQMGLSDEPEASSTQTPEASAPATVDAPEGFNFGNVKMNDVMMPEGLSIKLAPEKKEPTAPPPVAVTPAPVAAPAPMPVAAPAPMPAAAPAPVQVKPSAPPPPVVSAEERMEKTSLTTLTSTHTGFLSEFRTHFNAGMVLEIENETYLPMIWDEGFKKSGNEKEKRRSLNEPSCFRVAYRTKMPYIGHIVDTPQNKEFFASFGFTELPKAALVQPVKINNHVTHILLALYEPGRKTHHVVAAGEALVQKFIASISANGGGSVAA